MSKLDIISFIVTLVTGMLGIFVVAVVALTMLGFWIGVPLTLLFVFFNAYTYVRGLEEVVL